MKSDATAKHRAPSLETVKVEVKPFVEATASESKMAKAPNYAKLIKSFSGDTDVDRFINTVDEISIFS